MLNPRFVKEVNQMSTCSNAHNLLPLVTHYDHTTNSLSRYTIDCVAPVMLIAFPRSEYCYWCATLTEGCHLTPLTKEELHYIQGRLAI